MVSAARRSPIPAPVSSAEGYPGGCHKGVLCKFSSLKKLGERHSGGGGANLRGAKDAAHSYTRRASRPFPGLRFRRTLSSLLVLGWDRPMADNDAQGEVIVYANSVLKARYHHDPDVYVTGTC